jgi:hypothetical protein
VSYCRFDDGTNPFNFPPDLYQGRSDAYIFHAVEGHWECCGCWLGKEWRYPTKEAMLVHIAEHRAAGHVIPEFVDEELRQEIAEEQA